MAARIVVPDDHPAYLAGTAAERRLRQLGEVALYDAAPRDAGELIARVRDADIAVGVYTQTKWTDAVLAACPRLKLISRCGTGLDGIDLEACKRRGVAVAHLIANDADEIAEHAIALMLCALRRIPQLDRAVRAGGWPTPHIRGARGLTLGVVGLGAIGSRTAALAQAIGMDVLAWSYGPDGGRAARSGAAAVERGRVDGEGKQCVGSAARAAAARNVRGRRRGEGGPRLRHQPGALRGRTQRPACRRPGL